MSRELDAKVAEKVLGFSTRKVSAPGGITVWYYQDKEDEDMGERLVMSYTVDPSADYEVLKRVREKWRSADQHHFHSHLLSILRDKVPPDKMTWWDMEPSRAAVFYYEPGDYSKAALKALGEDI